MHHGTKSEAEAQTDTLHPSDEDTVTVYRPQYGRFELWIWDRIGGWQFMNFGTEAAMNSIGKSIN